jgi:hypothetical protein
MAHTPEPHARNAAEPQLPVADAPVAPPPPPRRSKTTVDWAAAGRKAWETRRRNAARRAERKPHE